MRARNPDLFQSGPDFGTQTAETRGTTKTNIFRQYNYASTIEKRVTGTPSTGVWKLHKDTTETSTTTFPITLFVDEDEGPSY